jgi:hypothetical protein
MQLRIAAHMHFIDDRALPRSARGPVVAPGEGWVDDPAARHEGGAVSLVEGQIIATFLAVAEHRGVPVEATEDRLRIRVEQQLVRVEAMAVSRIVRPVHTVPVEATRAGVRQKSVPDLIGELRQFDALDLALAALVKQAQLDLGRSGGKQREIDPKSSPGSAKWEGATLAQERTASNLQRPDRAQRRHRQIPSEEREYIFGLST